MTSTLDAEREALERLRRRAIALETGSAMLRAEIDALTARLSPRPALPSGQRLDIGLERLFIPGGLSAGRRIEAYRRQLGMCWFGFDASKFRPEIRLWHRDAPMTGDEGGGPPRLELVVDLLDTDGASWLLFEIELNWKALAQQSHIAAVLVGRASSTTSMGFSLYAEDDAGAGMRLGYQKLALGPMTETLVAPVALGEEFLARSDKRKPPKIHFHLNDAGSTRLELRDLAVVALDEGG